MESGLSDPYYISTFNSMGLNLSSALKELWNIFSKILQRVIEVFPRNPDFKRRIFPFNDFHPNK